MGNAVARVSPDPLDRPRITRSKSDGLARIPSDGLRDAPRASTDGLARFLSDKLRSRSRASIGRTHIRNPLARFPTDGLARIRKADADSTISQPRYGRNQPPRNHEPTILRVEYTNDTISTKPSYFSDSPTLTTPKPQPNHTQIPWRKIVRSESFASEVPRILHAKIA